LPFFGKDPGHPVNLAGVDIERLGRFLLEALAVIVFSAHQVSDRAFIPHAQVVGLGNDHITVPDPGRP